MLNDDEGGRSDGDLTQWAGTLCGPHKLKSMTVILSSALATLSYLPFQLVAKVTIGVCALLFVVDPYPGSRLISLICTGVVLLINRAKAISP